MPFARQAAGQPQHDLFRHLLHRGRQIHVALVQQFGGVARLAAEQRVEPAVGHGQAGAIIEIVEIEPETAVILEVDEMIEDRLRIFRLAIGREPHHLVLAGIDLEAGVVGEGRIEQPDRVREVDLAPEIERVVPAVAA